MIQNITCKIILHCSYFHYINDVMMCKPNLKTETSNFTTLISVHRKVNSDCLAKICWLTFIV